MARRRRRPGKIGTRRGRGTRLLVLLFVFAAILAILVRLVGFTSRSIHHRPLSSAPGMILTVR